MKGVSSFACGTCQQRPRGTTSKRGRTLQRYPSDDAKATLRQAMADPENQTRYRQRQAMVELVSSILRQPRGVNRFRRRGVCAVRCEFALHVMAYNLGRAFLPLVVQAIGPFRS